MVPSQDRKFFFPVIHCVDPYLEGGIGHALSNTRTAIENGADGVFLIGHNLPSQDLFYIYENVRKQFPDTWIGINFLDVSVDDRQTLSRYAKDAENLNALWFDKLPKTPLALPSSISIFGGVAFKYINPDLDGEELYLECIQAVQNVNVATTSGNRTGSPPDALKLEKIKNNLAGRIPLAVASGINSSNISSFLKTVDIFLVASSICQPDKNRGSQEYLVPEKVRELANLIHFNK